MGHVSRGRACRRPSFFPCSHLLCCYTCRKPRAFLWEGVPVKRITLCLAAAAALAGVVAAKDPPVERPAEAAAPIFGITLPPGYRDWRLISVAQEKGDLNDIRAVLGNDIAVKAFRESKGAFPD